MRWKGECSGNKWTDKPTNGMISDLKEAISDIEEAKNDIEKGAYAKMKRRAGASERVDERVREWMQGICPRADYQ